MGNIDKIMAEITLQVWAEHSQNLLDKKELIKKLADTLDHDGRYSCYFCRSMYTHAEVCEWRDLVKQLETISQKIDDILATDYGIGNKHEVTA